MDKLPALQERIEKLSTDELLEIVTLEFRGYRKEALALARAELNRRGFRDSDISLRAHDFTAQQQPDGFQLQPVAVGVITGLITVFLFPAAFYYSIVVYGLFASALMTVGYVIWRLLIRANPRLARGFGFGFIPPVLLILVVSLSGVPWLVLAILAEFLVFSLTIRFFWPD